VGCNFVKQFDLFGLNRQPMVELLLVMQLVEHADLSVRLHDGLPPLLDLVLQLLGLLVERGELRLQCQFETLHLEQLVDVRMATAKHPPAEVQEGSLLRARLSTALVEYLLRRKCLRQATAQLVAMDLAEASQRLKAKAKT
jgi:hypothetical protein